MNDAELLSHTRSLLWRAWASTDDEIGSVAAATLLGLGMLVPEGGAAELDRLTSLVNAQPAELSEEQMDALIDAGNGALSDYYHERACACSEYPAGCVTNEAYARARGFWDTDAFAVGMSSVIGLWESLRADVQAAELARLRARLAELEAAARPAILDLPPSRVTRRALARPLPARTALCDCGHTGLEHHHAGTACWAHLARTPRASMAEPLPPVEICGCKEFVAARPQATVEDPHDSPLDRPYRLCRDLPAGGEAK